MKRSNPRERLDALRPVIGAAFLAAYAANIFVPGTLPVAALLSTGGLLFAMSVPWSSAFHKGFALVAFATLGATILTGRFDAGRFLEDLPTYFGIVAVLLVLSVAGYPIRAARFAEQIRALVGAMARRGVGYRAASGAVGHVLGAVLDVGAFVLVDVVSRRAAPEDRIPALLWSGRAFSFAPLWTNLNLLTATTVTLTGVAYPALLAVSLPFVLVCLPVTLLFAQGEKDVVEAASETPLNREAAAVLLYPVLLVAVVAAASVLLPRLPLTAVISLTVTGVVVLISLLATLVLRNTAPLYRLGRESREALAGSHAEFTLFGAAGVFVVSLTQLGALEPVGRVFASLPAALVAPALMFTLGAGFLAGIHVVPMVLLVHAAFPLDGGSTPALWALAILLGSQSTLLLSPFSNTVTMLAWLSGLHPLEVGPQSNLRFSAAVSLAGLAYLGLLTLLLL